MAFSRAFGDSHSRCLPFPLPHEANVLGKNAFKKFNSYILQKLFIAKLLRGPSARESGAPYSLNVM